MADAFPALTATTSTTTGTTAALALSTTPGTSYYRTPKQAVADGCLADGDNVFYAIIDKTQVGDALFEIGYGAYDDTANTITRSAGNVISGSAGPGALATLPGSGTRDVIILDHIPVTSAQVSSSNALRIDSSGKVGLGLSAPSVQLHLAKSQALGTPTLDTAEDIAVFQNSNTGTHAAINIISSAGGSSRINFGDQSDKDAGEISYNNNTDTLTILAGTVETIRASSSEVTINEGGGDIDFRVEGDTDTNLLVCDASNDAVGIGIAAPTSKLTVNGTARFTGADFRVEGSGDSNLFRIDYTDTEVVIGAISGPYGAVLFVDGAIGIVDGMTAPSNTAGVAKIYVDTSDGDLKIVFGDGTVKTIVTDT